MEDEGASLPSNYVTFLQLKQRWLQQQSSDSQSTVKPDEVPSASKTPIDAVPPTRDRWQLKPDYSAPDSPNHHRDVNQLKPQVTVRDSASKIANETDPPVVNQPKPEVTIHDSASKTLIQSNSKVSTTKNSFRSRNPRFHEKQEHSTDQSNSEVSTTKKSSSRGRNPRFVTDQIPTGSSTTPPLEDVVQEKKQHRHPVVHNSDQSNSKLSTKKNSSIGRNRNPRLVTDQIPTGGSTTMLELVQEKKENHHIDNDPIVEKQVHNSSQPNSKVSMKKNVSRNRNPRLSTALSKPEPMQDIDNDPIVEKQEHNSSHSNSKDSMKKNGSRDQNPRFASYQIRTVGSTVLSEPELQPMQEHSSSQSEVSMKKNGSRDRNHRFATDQIRTGGRTALLEPEPMQDKGNDPMVEKQEHNSSQSKVSRKKNSSRNRNPRFVTDQIPTGGSTALSEPEPVRDRYNDPMVEKQEHNSSQSNSKVSTKKNGSRNRKSKFATDQIPTEDSTREPEPVQEKKQHRQNWNRNQEVGEPKGKMQPRAQNVEDLSQNDSGGDGVVEAVAAGVKEISVTDASRRTNGRHGSARFSGSGRHGSRRFNGGRGHEQPWVKKEQTVTAVWVKKGESKPN